MLMQAFYNKENLNPNIHGQAQDSRVMTVPEGVDTDLLMKVLGNPKDRIVIENPGGFLDGITENNIITHPSVPRNKLIAETLQNLKYVQRTGQGVDIMFKDMVSMGKPYPRYKSFSDAVSLTIFNAIDNTGFVKFNY